MVHDPAPDAGRPRPVVAVEIGCGAAPRLAVDPAADPASDPAPDPAPDRLAVVIDLDRGSLVEARSGRTDLRVIAADAMALPLRDGACGEVSAYAVLHHLVPTDRAIAELVRIVGPGGRLTLSDGVALDGAEAAALDAELRAAGLAPEPVYGLDPRAVADLVSTLGLRVERIDIEGTTTFATPPYVSRAYRTDRFVLTARRDDLAPSTA